MATTTWLKKGVINEVTADGDSIDIDVDVSESGDDALIEMELKLMGILSSANSSTVELMVAHAAWWKASGSLSSVDVKETVSISGTSIGDTNGGEIGILSISAPDNNTIRLTVPPVDSSANNVYFRGTYTVTISNFDNT